MRVALICVILLQTIFAQTTCPEGKTYVKFTKNSGTYAVEESWELYDGATKVYSSPTLENNVVRVVEECIDSSVNNQYTLKLKDDHGDSWNSNSFLTIEGINGNIVFKNFMTAGTEETYTLSLYAPISKNDSWKMTSGSAEGTWTQYNFADTTWTEVTLGSESLSPVTGAQYFRKTFTGLTGLAVYELGLNYRHGIVVYMNGVEVYRDNMEPGAVTSESVCVGTYSTVSYHSIIRPANEVEAAQSVVAIELHFLTTESSNDVYFNSYLTLHASTVTGTDRCYIYPYSTTVTGQSSGSGGIGTIAGSNAATMFDFKKGTNYNIASTDLPKSTPFTFNGPKPLINGIRVWPYTSPVNTPSVFQFEGADSSSATTWTTIVSSGGMVYESQVYQIANGYFNTGFFNNHRLNIVKSNGALVNAYEMQPVVCVVTMPTSVEYAQSTYSYYAKFDQVDIRPIIGEFSNCVINPSPAAGLTFDAASCALTGVVSTAGTTSYTVTSTMNGQTYTGSFSLTITECSGVLASILRTYKTSAANEGFTIKDAASQTVVLQVNANSGQQNSVDWSAVVCLPNTKYIVETTCTGKTWMSNSYLYVNAILGDGEVDTITRVRFDDYISLPTSTTIITQFAVKPLETWFYKMGEVPTNWYNTETSGWSSATAGSFTASTNQIQLYKKTFTVSSLTDFSGVVISLKYQYGFIIYLNNQEVARKGFTGDLSTSTVSTTFLSEVNFHQISLPVKTIGIQGTPAVNYINTGTNTIAIALVAAGPAMTTSTFDCAIRLMGTSARSLTYTGVMNGLNGSANLMFSDYYGVSMYYSLCGENSYEITLDNDRREWFNALTVQLYYNQNTQHVRQFVLKAKNPEDTEYTTLKTVTGMTWSLQGQKVRIWIPNSKPYNIFRFENFASGSVDNCYWKFGTLQFYNEVPVAEVPALSYASTISIFKDIEVAEVYPNSEYYYDFTITPSLPQGIAIDPNTGTISGTTHTVTPTTAYTVSAKKYNTGETMTTQFTMTTDVCTNGRSLITFVARVDANNKEASYKVYQGKGTTGTVVYEIDHFKSSSTLNYGDFCFNHGMYTLEVKDSSNGWSMPGGYYLYVDVDPLKFEMGQVYNAGQSPVSVTKYFSSYLPFQMEYDDWKVYKDSGVAENWNTIAFDDSTWTLTKAAEIGTTESTTVYLRREVTLDDVNNYQVLNVRIKYTGGVVAYFNGRRVARFNIIDDFVASTESMTLHDGNAYSMFHIVLPTVGAVTGKNVMAFEVHRPLGQSSAEPVVFDATGVFGVNDCSIGVDSIINVSGSTAYTIGALENFFDLTPVSYGYQSNAVGTYLQWTVENLEGTKFNSFAMETTYDRSSWGFSLYGRENEYEDEDPNAEEYTDIFDGVELSSLQRKRVAWPAPVGIAGFRQFKYEVDDPANSAVYIAAYIFQYCKASGEGTCPGEGDYPAVGEGEISPADCDYGYKGYSYRMCSNGVLGDVQTDKCVYKLPAMLAYDSERYVAVVDTETVIAAPTYLNLITKFHVEPAELPAGLTLDEKTGAITGKPTTEVDLQSFTVFGENPSGVVSASFALSVRKGECKAEGNFVKTVVGETAVFECSALGSYVGTQKRTCVLSAKDGEWQDIKGMCIPVSILVILILVALVIIAIVVFVIMRKMKKAKAVGGVKGKKNTANTKTMKKTKAATKEVKV